MSDIVSSESGEIIEQPMSTEVYDRLPEPDDVIVGDQDEIKKWQSRIDVARKTRDEKLKDLNLLMDLYEGNQWGSGMPNMNDKTTINLIFANIKKELPNLYFQNPSPIVNPTRQEFELNAYAMQELLKSYVKNNLGTELKKHIRLCILDAKFSFGCTKVSYTPRFSVNPNKDQPILAGYDGLGMPVFVTDNEGNILTESGEILTSEFYYVERISPREVLIDSKCRNFPERAEWIGHEIVKPLVYLKNSKLYKNRKFLKRNVELSDVFKQLNKDIQHVSDLVSDEDKNQVRFVEIYDLKNEKLLVLPDDQDFFIREESIDINPFSFLKFNEKPDDFYPVSDVAQEKPLQKEVNIGRSLMLTHARRSARKYAYSSETWGGVDEIEGIEAMKDPEDLTLVKVGDLDKIPVPIQMAAQDPSIFQNVYQSRIDYNEVAGTTEAQRGLTERRKTKGEASFQEGHGAVRKTDKQSLVGDFIADSYSKLGQLMQRTLAIPQAIKIIGPTGAFWTQVGKKDIQGGLKYDIEVSDLRPQIPELDKQEISEFIFALSNFLNAILANPVGPMVFNLQGTIKEFAKSYPSINVENILNINVTPEQIIQVLMNQMQQGGQGGRISE
jgi:hypothetical protein